MAIVFWSYLDRGLPFVNRVKFIHLFNNYLLFLLFCVFNYVVDDYAIKMTRWTGIGIFLTNSTRDQLAFMNDGDSILYTFGVEEGSSKGAM